MVDGSPVPAAAGHGGAGGGHGVQRLTRPAVLGKDVDIAGPMPPSVGDLKKALVQMNLRNNAISTVPSQIALLNKLTGL